MVFLNRISRKLLLIAFLGVSGFLLTNISLNHVIKLRQKSASHSETSRKEYLVDTPLCKIPKVDPYDPSIINIVRKTGQRHCSAPKALTYSEGLAVSINWTAALQPPYNGDLQHCTLMPLYRPKYTPTHNNYLRYLEEGEPFNETMETEHDFVKATCYNGDGDSIYINFHAFIQPNQTADRMYKDRMRSHVTRDRITERLNVMVIGMDSVSRLSFIRQMVKTRKLLLEKMEAFDMMGYNKVADNTFINIVPMTLGKFVAEMPWDESKAGVPFDDFNFIWKQFKEKGYRTFYAEDAPDIAIFDMLKAGFNTPPTDYFNRPISSAMEMNPKLWSNNHHCFQDKLETEIVLDYLHDFADTFQNDPYFAFTFITRLSHDDVNSAGAADEPYFRFFNSLHKKGLLRNTVLVFFSDHGMRFGDIRETYIGKLEERLPFMYIVVPKWLRQSYPFLQKNLKNNQHRLSSPFDIYETLRDILYFNGFDLTVNKTARGVSMFRAIPDTRSCDTAGILPHWCTCLHQENLDVRDHVVTEASIVLLSEIVRSLRNYTEICEPLSIKTIRQATRLVESDDVLKFVKSQNTGHNSSVVFGERTKPIENIQVVIETVPGNALFEATVRYDTVYDSFKVVGDISRINMYGHQSDCIDVFKLKKYCQCKLFSAN